MTAINDTATDKQLAFRAGLISDVLDNAGRQCRSLKAAYAAEHVVKAAVALAMPMPATKTEASAQIDALKGDVMSWARAAANQAAAQAVVDKLVAAFGEDAAQWPRPGSQTELRALLVTVA